MYRYFNNNPCGRSVGDCAVRAISAAFGISWERAFDILADNARQMCDMPSSDSVWGATLRMMGYVREAVNDRMTVEEFAEENPNGIFVAKTNGHVVCVRDGVVYDSWDSSQEDVIYVWKRDRNRRDIYDR